MNTRFSLRFGYQTIAPGRWLQTVACRWVRMYDTVGSYDALRWLVPSPALVFCVHHPRRELFDEEEEEEEVRAANHCSHI